MDLQSYFDRVVVVSLRRTPQRIAAFWDRLPRVGWPFMAPDVFDAIDGRVCPPPSWFGTEPMNGAWGVYRSHLACIERAMNDGIQRLLLLEDDAEPVDGFGARVARFLDALPADAELVYLGGQTNHYQGHPAQSVNAEVIRPWSVNRLHAFFLTAAGMRKAYQHLTTRYWITGHHIDHHLERLSRAGKIKTYAPKEWLVGQAKGYSTILGRHLRERRFDRAGMQLPIVVPVVGPYRGGTSAVAGAMHNLGIPMGNRFFQGGADASPKGCFEAQMLYDLCEKCYPEPEFKEGKPYARRVQLLRQWMLGRTREGAIIGAKHPKLCLMVPEMIEAWPNCQLVVVDRPITKIIDSLRKLGWWSKTVAPEALIGRLVATRDRDLLQVPADRILRLEFDRLMADPRPHLERVADFADIEPTPEQYDLAVAHLDRNLDHHPGTTDPESETPPMGTSSDTVSDETAERGGGDIHATWANFVIDTGAMG